jgi:hypothetical protein
MNHPLKIELAHHLIFLIFIFNAWIIFSFDKDEVDINYIACIFYNETSFF